MVALPSRGTRFEVQLPSSTRLARTPTLLAAAQKNCMRGQNGAYLGVVVEEGHCD